MEKLISQIKDTKPFLFGKISKEFCENCVFRNTEMFNLPCSECRIQISCSQQIEIKFKPLNRQYGKGVN